MQTPSYVADLRKAFGLLGSALRPRPSYVVLQLTRRCNLRCGYCDFYKEPTKPDAELDLEKVEALSEKLAQMGPCVVCVSGGEPTIRKDLPEVTKRLARWHYPTLITNGWFMTRELAQELFAAGMEEISVSVDYATPIRHDARRGMPGSWIRAIEALQILRKASGGWRNRVYMNTVLLEDNVEEIEALLHLTEALGVTFRLSLYSAHRGAMRAPAPGVAEHLLELKKRHPHFVSLTGYLEGIDQALSGGVPSCQAGKLFCFVDAVGDVYRCVEQRDPAVGNLLRDPSESLLERLRTQCSEQSCSGCWTSTRGSTEVVLGRHGLRDRAEFLASLRG